MAYQTLGIKTSYVKEVLVREFGAGQYVFVFVLGRIRARLCTILAAVVHTLKLLSLY